MKTEYKLSLIFFLFIHVNLFAQRGHSIHSNSIIRQQPRINAIIHPNTNPGAIVNHGHTNITTSIIRHENTGSSQPKMNKKKEDFLIIKNQKGNSELKGDKINSPKKHK